MKILSIIASAALFTFLFYQESAGLNVFIMNILILAAFFIFRDDLRNNNYFRIIAICCFLSSLAVLLYGYWWPVFVNVICLSVLAGHSVITRARTIFTPLLSTLSNTVLASVSFFIELGRIRLGKRRSVGAVFRITILPLAVLAVFSGLYQASNPVFDTIMSVITVRIWEFIENMFSYLNPEFVFLFILGGIISCILLIPGKMNALDQFEQSSDEMERKGKWTGTGAGMPGIMYLRKEYKAGVLLLTLLNMLLLVVNLIDIQWVWFDFTWNGEYLKQFVHEGTYALIFSVLLAAGIILFFFRGKLNFFKRNKTLRILAGAWIIQNMVLCLSVGIRNLHYIEYYSLAFKRIGVFVFLFLIMAGLFTILVKIRQKKSFYYLIRINGLALMLVLSFTTLIDWDSLIARYNFSRYQTAFVHFDFLSELDNRALPELIKTNDELDLICESQIKLPFESDSYMRPETYAYHVAGRKDKFLEEYPKRGMLSWNLGEYLAWKDLSGK